MHTSLFESSIIARSAASAALCFAALGGCSSDKGTDSTKGAVEAGHQEAAVKYLECKNPQDLKSAVDQAPTGFVMCANSVGANALHRTEIKECITKLPRAVSSCTGIGSGTDSGAAIGICRTDAECTNGPQGYCGVTTKSPACSCHYGCKSDADCPSDRICVCGDPTGECVLAQCKSDAECGAGSLCISASDGACRRVFACQNAKDLCAGDRDCPPNYSQCTLEGDHRVCKAPPNCGI